MDLSRGEELEGPEDDCGDKARPGWCSRALVIRPPDKIRGPSFGKSPPPPREDGLVLPDGMAAGEAWTYNPSPLVVPGGLMADIAAGVSLGGSVVVIISLERLEKLEEELKELRSFVGIQKRDVGVNTDVVEEVDEEEEKEVETLTAPASVEEEEGIISDTDHEEDWVPLSFEGPPIVTEVELNEAVAATVAETSDNLVIPEIPESPPSPVVPIIQAATPVKKKKSKRAAVCDEEDHSCTQCGVIFRVEAALELHLKTAHVTRKFGCKYCPLGFLKQTLLSHHIKNEHSNDNSSTASPQPRQRGRPKNAKRSKTNKE